MFQEIPGAPVELAAARSTLSGIIKGQERFCKVTAARARDPDNWILERSKELPKLAREMLPQALAVRSLLLDAAGGGVITCAINGWDEYKVVVEVDGRGRLEEVTVVDFT